MSTEATDMDYRAMYDRDYIGAWDLVGRDVVVKIVKVEAKSLKNAQGTNKKPVIYFEGKEKALVCNKTNGKAIAGMYGTETRGWIGKWITLYPSTTSAGGETVDCVRVRPMVPRMNEQSTAPETTEQAAE